MDLSLEEGAFLVNLARRAIEHYSKYKAVPPKPLSYPLVMNEKRGVFVTLNRYPSLQLRGCIGYPLAYEALIDATISSAISAAFSDPRFLPLKTSEIGNVVVEITVLTPMILLDKNKNYESQIKIGRDGLFVVCEGMSGLLLPQVPVEWGWNEGQFLEEVCHKAGLDKDCYKNAVCDVYRFSGQIFEEREPNDKVMIKKI